MDQSSQLKKIMNNRPVNIGDFAIKAWSMSRLQGILGFVKTLTKKSQNVSDDVRFQLRLMKVLEIFFVSCAEKKKSRRCAESINSYAAMPIISA